MDEIRDRAIADFQRITAVQSAMMLLEEDIARSSQTVFRSEEVFRKIRKHPGCAGLPNCYLQQALHLWIKTHYAVEPEMEDDNHTVH